MPRHDNRSRPTLQVSSMLTALAMIPLLLAPALADAREPKPASDMITIELRELEGKSVVESRALIVPIDGSIAGSVLLFDRLHRCRLEAHTRDSSEAIELELRCHSGGRDDLNLELTVLRVLPIGDGLVVGELESTAGSRIQVVATRH